MARPTLQRSLNTIFQQQEPDCPRYRVTNPYSTCYTHSRLCRSPGTMEIDRQKPGDSLQFLLYGMPPYMPTNTNDRPPNVDGTLEQVLVGADYHSPSPLLPTPPPPQPHSIQPIKMPPLTEGRFMDAFMWFSNHTGIRLNEQAFFIEGHQVNPWELYRSVASRNGFDSVRLRDHTISVSSLINQHFMFLR